MKLLFILLVFIRTTSILCLNYVPDSDDIFEYGGYSFLTTNYTIDFARNIQPQKCYSDNECPHYSYGCDFSRFNFQNNYSKEELIQKGYYGICNYSFYCKENNNKSILNSNCVAIHGNGRYSLKPGFESNELLNVYHCNEKSVKNKDLCRSGRYMYSCNSNKDCFTNRCSNRVCLESKDFTIYCCSITFDRNQCKLLNHEYYYREAYTECDSTYGYDGYCISKSGNYVKTENIKQKVNYLIIIVVVLFFIVLIFLIKRFTKDK